MHANNIAPVPTKMQLKWLRTFFAPSSLEFSIKRLNSRLWTEHNCEYLKVQDRHYDKENASKIHGHPDSWLSKLDEHFID